MKRQVRYKIIVFILALSTASIGLQASQTSETLNTKIIKDIKITGNHYTKEYVIMRELTSKVGQPYTEENAQEDYKNLDNLGIFSDVEIEPIEEDDGIVLSINVTETFPYIPTITIKISDEDGIQYGAGFKTINLGGRAVYFKGLALFGGAKNLQFELRNPWISGTRLGYYAEFYHRNRQNTLFDYEEIADEIYFTLSTPIGSDSRFGGRVFFHGIESDTPGITLSGDDLDNVLTLGLFIGYDSRDLWSNPTSGWWNEVEILKVGGLVGDSDFWRLTFDIGYFIPIANLHTLAVFSLLTVTSGTIGEDVAVWQQYGLGGTNSIRGWELGSRTGKNQFINTIEYRYNILKPQVVELFGLTLDVGIQLSAFTDFGHAWNDPNDFKWDNFIKGYGIGVRLLVPFVDIARFDVGWGQPGMGIRLHLGSFEKSYRQRKRVR